MIIEKDVTVDEIIENLAKDEFNRLKEYFYDECKDTYIAWLVEEGKVEEVE